MVFVSERSSTIDSVSWLDARMWGRVWFTQAPFPPTVITPVQINANVLSTHARYVIRLLELSRHHRTENVRRREIV